MTTNGRPKLTIRMEREERDAFVQATRHHDDGAAGVVRDFINAYMAGPRAKMPRRPKPETDPEQQEAPPSPGSG